MKRREFLKRSLAAATVAGLAGAVETRALAAARPRGKQEYYELRAYRLKSGANHELLDRYLEQAAIPAWNRLGVKPVGVFTEIEPKGNPSVFVLIPYASPDALAKATARLNADKDYQEAGKEYLQSPKSNPAFERIDSWLMLAFAGMPRLEIPAYSKEKKPRIFEIRTYESHSELKALKKVDMFNSGEIDVMREVGLAPVFYGQALIGPNLPHLTYMLSAENQDEHKKHWGAFGKHPVWDKMKNDPQYADTVSKITNWMVAPTAYSQI
ncbi:MAG TPA: NIPSNAP family protein [Verrucomicrobiae bacterium]